MKIGILGGSFNPPHNTHQKIATTLIEKKYLDRVIFVPTGDKYDKSNLINASHRYDMVKLLCSDFSDFEVSDFELKHTLVKTYQTMDYFQSIYPNDTLYFIVGTDNLKQFKTWANYKYLISTYHFLVIPRDYDNIAEILKEFHEDRNNFTVVDFQIDPLSSTLIRDLFKKDLNSVKPFLNSKVFNYILANSLYQI